MTDGVSVVGAASPCAARGMVSSVIGRWPAASPSSEAAPQQRAISRSSCSNCSSSIRTPRRFYATRVDRDRGETVAAVTPDDNYEYFSRILPVPCAPPSRCTAMVAPPRRLTRPLRRDDTGARSRAFQRLSRAPRVATYRIRNRSVARAYTRRSTVPVQCCNAWPRRDAVTIYYNDIILLSDNAMIVVVARDVYESIHNTI